MAIKIKKNGVVHDLVINASEVTVLDAEGNFRSKNLETVLKELNMNGGSGDGTGTGGSGYPKDAEYVYVKDTEPDMDGVWFDESDVISDDSNIQENSIVKSIREYIDTDVKKIVESNDVIVKDIQEKVGNKLDVVPQLSNPNLLINSDFKVWQRGETISSSNITYSADRWIYTGGGTYTATKSEDGMVISRPTTGSIYLRQRVLVDDLKGLVGKSLTISAEVKGNTNIRLQLYDRINSIGLGNSITNSTSVDEFSTITLTIDDFSYESNITYLEVSIICPSAEVDSPITIKWVKLESGSYATPFISRSYGEELALCQRYYQVTTLPQNVVASDSKQLQIGINGIPMRIKPTAKYQSVAYAHSADTGTKVLTLCSNVNSPETTLVIAGWIENGTTFAIDIRELTDSDVGFGELWTINDSNSASNRLSGVVKVAFDAEIY